MTDLIDPTLIDLIPDDVHGIIYIDKNNILKDTFYLKNKWDWFYHNYSC